LPQIPDLFYAGGTQIRNIFINQRAIAEAIATAPGWALVALTVSQERLREAGQREVAEHAMASIVGRIRDVAEQLPLPL
jgi:hypothetical protein